MSLETAEIPLQQQFDGAISSEDQLGIKELLNDQNISAVANLIYENEDYETQIIAHLSIHRAASVFKILDAAEQKRIIKNLSAFKSAELLNELPPDDRVDFFEEQPTGMVRELIKTLEPAERKITLELLGYSENSVGRLMTPDYVYVLLKDNDYPQFGSKVLLIRKSEQNILVLTSSQPFSKGEAAGRLKRNKIIAD